MSDINLYWAEEALGEPYAPQDYRWLKSTRRAGLLFGGATSILTASALLGGAVFYLVDSSPHVAIFSYEIEAGAHVTQQPPTPPAAPAPRAEGTVQARTSTKEPSSRASIPTAQAIGPTQAAVPGVRTKVPPVPTPSKARSSAVSATHAKTPLAEPTEARKLAPAPAPTAAPVPSPAHAVVVPPAVAAAPATPVAKPEPDTRMGVSKGADSKPTDIASGEKLGIREILPDGIVMQNGRKVKNGSALPNGELLMGTDATKGMAETDRRVLVLTP